jgi:hypothetical protein
MNPKVVNPPQSTVTVSSGNATALVIRSAVEAGLPYFNYRQYLRHDFYYSCAYCTMSEAEATAIRFTIDHYEPKSGRPDLINEYTNLMYSCDQCNLLKGNRSPTPEARANGYRYIRPDQDAYSDHLSLSGVRLTPKTHVGEFSIEAIDLNRKSLRKLRELRQRLADCEQVIAEGVAGLRRFHNDQLPTNLKGQAGTTIARSATVAQKMADDIVALLRNHARSPLIDPDNESEGRAKERAEKLNEWASLYPGNWRAQNKEK